MLIFKELNFIFKGLSVTIHASYSVECVEIVYLERACCALISDGHYAIRICDVRVI